MYLQTWNDGQALEISDIFVDPSFSDKITDYASIELILTAIA